MGEEKDDEIIVGVNIPKVEKKKFKKKSKTKKTNNSSHKSNVNHKIITNKKKSSKENKKSKARISSNNSIFINRLIRKFILMILIIIAIILFLSSSFFDITNIEVTNNEFISKDEIISLSEIGNKKNIFSIDSKKIKNKLTSNAYIEDVKISRKLPNTVNIEIAERKVKYMIQFGEAYVYINHQGYILDISNEKKDIPILLGIVTDISKFHKGNRLVLEDLNKLDMVNRIYEVANNNEILALISKIDLSDLDNYTLYLDSERKIAYLGSCNDLNTRILYVKAILEQESGIEGEIFVNVDLNEDNVFFREKI